MCFYSHDHLVSPQDDPLLSSPQQAMDLTTYASLTDSEELISSIFDDEEEQSAIQCVLEASKLMQSSGQELSFQGRVPATKTIARGDCSWYRDYLSPHPVYPPSCFREVFHLPLSIYNKVHALLVANEPLFRTRTNAFGLRGHSSHQKILFAIRKLATGLSFKQLDDMARMSSESQRLYFELFLRSLKRNFGPLLLNRPPTLSELRSVAKKYEEEGFPGCIGCVDCMHIHWKNCPKALKGQYHNPKAGKRATISCEAMVDNDLHC